MSSSFIQQGGSAAAKGLAPRQRLVIDPIWKATNAGTYNRFWDCLTQEAALYGFVGFDMEWTTKMVAVDDGDDVVDGAGRTTSSPTRRKPRRWTGPVATIQLSTYSYTLVVRWNHLHALVSGNDSAILRDPFAPYSSTWPAYRVGQKSNPPSLLRKVYNDVKGLITNPVIFLVGVGIHGDEVKLHRDYPKITAQSAVELTALAEACLPDVVPDIGQLTSDSQPRQVRTDALQSLKKLCAALTGKELGKDMTVVMSDWGGCHGALTPLQIEYSAEDAEASYDVCVAILRGGGFLSESHTSTAPWKTAENFDCREVLACCSTSAEKGASSSSPVAESAFSPGSSLTTQVASPTAAIPSGEEKVDSSWCKGRSKPYYDNIRVYSPDMELVFTVDRTKADWYVNRRELATVVQWRPVSSAALVSADSTPSPEGTGEMEMAAIQLKFAPDFERYNDAHIRRNLEYFKQPKENICVVCGSGGALVRFAVVPLMYRRFFPSVYMSHNSYDLLLLCPACFAKSRTLYEQQRFCVTQDFGIPIAHLRGTQLEAYAQEVRRAEEEVEAMSSAFTARHESRTAERAGTFERDCDLHPRLKLQGMQDYRALMEHREVLDKVFSYAKALFAHYLSQAPGGEGVVSESPMSYLLSTGNRRGKRHANAAANARAAKPTAIPEERRQMMADFLRANAPSYPFYAEAEPSSVTDTPAGSSPSHLDGAELQDAVFGDGGDGAASLSGVQLILTGRIDNALSLLAEAAGVASGEESGGELRCSPPPLLGANRSRSVLSRYWVKTHPELLATLPTVTRMEERQRETGGKEEDDDGAGTLGGESVGTESQADSDASDVPYVDNHAFVVLQMLMRKYEKAGPTGKTAEHAVGQFIYRWRSAFVEGLRPQHLPRGWEPEDGILR